VFDNVFILADFSSRLFSMKMNSLKSKYRIAKTFNCFFKWIFN